VLRRSQCGSQVWIQRAHIERIVAMVIPRCYRCLACYDVTFAAFTASHAIIYRVTAAAVVTVVVIIVVINNAGGVHAAACRQQRRIGRSTSGTVRAASTALRRCRRHTRRHSRWLVQGGGAAKHHELP